MSKDLNSNERYFKELADNHKQVPPPMVWNEIEQVLDKDKAKRRLFPLLMIFGVSFMGAIMFINLNGKEDKDTSIVDNETSISDYQKQSDSNHRDIIKVDSEVINEIKHGQNANLSETAPTVSDNRKENKVDSKKLETFVKRQHQQNNINTYSEHKPSNANTNTINSNEKAIITEENISRPIMSTREDMNIRRVTALQRLKWISRPLETIKTLPDPSENFTAILNSESKNNASNPAPWFVQLGGGIGRNLSNSVLIDPTQGGYRLDTESKWYSWSTSFQLGYQFDNLWYTTIGFDLNQTKNKFDFWRRDVSSLKVSENQDLQITNNDFFNIGEISYTFADVGLSLGKRVNLDKWHFSLEGGAIFNVLFNANGKVQIGELEFSRLENQDGYFNNQIGMGARLSAMIDHPISDHLWISVGPIYHQYFNTVSSDENPLEERNAILQVKAKVRYSF